MTPEEQARRYAYQRPNHELVGYAEVGLPFYRLIIRAFTLEHKQIPPIEEFVLKAITQGLTSASDIAGFLGLKEAVIRNALTNLVRSEDVCISGSAQSTQHAWRLTTNGERTLKAAELLVPEEGTYPVDFDGLLRRPERYPRESSYAPKQVRDLGMMEVRATPAKAPEVGDLPLKEVERIIRRIGSGNEARRDLISIKSIENRRRHFRRATLLTYKAKDGDELQYAFVVDGRLSDEYENAFVRAGGPSRIGIERHLLSAASRSPLQFIPPELASQFPSKEELDEIRGRAVAAKIQFDDAKQELARAAKEEIRIRVKKELRIAEKYLNDTTKLLDAYPMRFLSVYEHAEILNKALEESTQRLMITSSGIRTLVVDGSFERRLEILLRRGVKVYIGYGVGEEGGKQRKSSNESAESRLRLLARQFPNFIFKCIGDDDQKVLIYDSVSVAITSFNWLSFRGDSNHLYHDEQGVLISIPNIIEKRFYQELERFDLSASEPKGTKPNDPADAANTQIPSPLSQRSSKVDEPDSSHQKVRPVTKAETNNLVPLAPNPAIHTSQQHSAKQPVPSASQPMPTVSQSGPEHVNRDKKIRVYDLAKELKLDNKRVIEDARREGIDVTIPSNTIPTKVADRIRNKYFPQKSASTSTPRLQKAGKNVTATLEAYSEPAPKPGGQDIAAMIAKGESNQLEFKSSARWDYKQGKQSKLIEEIVVKTVAAFLNTDGGNLLIGVDDERNVLGLDPDYKLFGKKDSRDAYENFLTTLLLANFGKDISALISISIYELDGKDVAKVTARPSPKPIFVKDANYEHLYIRAGNSTRQLNARETVDYVKFHWS